MSQQEELGDEKAAKIWLVDGREAWGSTFLCSIMLTWLWVTAIYCAAVLLSFLPSLSSALSLLFSLLLSFFPSSVIASPSIISPRLLLPRSVFFLCLCCIFIFFPIKHKLKNPQFHDPDNQFLKMIVIVAFPLAYGYKKPVRSRYSKKREIISLPVR